MTGAEASRRTDLRGAPAALKVGDRLPDVDLDQDGKPAALRAPRAGAPLLLLPPAGTDSDAPYLRSFLDGVERLELWGGRPLVVVGSAPEAKTLAGRYPHEGHFAVDRSGRLREALGLGDSEWGLAIADRWGIVYHWAHSESPRELPDLGEIQEWAKFLATQCPECGVIDQPSPEE